MQPVLTDTQDKSASAVDSLVDVIEPLFGDSTAFVAVVTGADHVFRLSNGANNELLGRRDLIGRPVRSAVPEAESQGLVTILDDVLTSGTPFHAKRVALSFFRGDQLLPSEHILNFDYHPIFGSDDGAVGVFVHGVEVTESERARFANEAIEDLGVTSLGWSSWKKSQSDFLAQVDRRLTKLDLPFQSALESLRELRTLEQAKVAVGVLEIEVSRLQAQIRHVLDGLRADE